MNSLSVYVGPIIICDPGKDMAGGKKPCEVDEKRLYRVTDESGGEVYVDKHVFAPNTGDYTIDVPTHEGILDVLYRPALVAGGAPDVSRIEYLMINFAVDFGREVANLRAYYGKYNVKVAFAIYSYIR